MIKKTKFKDLVLIDNVSFKDNRGYFRELLKEKDLNRKFPFLVMSFSKKNVIRGLHLQTKNSQGKFISVIKGKIFDVVVDLRKKSKTYGKSFSVILSEKNAKSIFIPPGFAHGFCVLSQQADILYQCSSYYAADDELTLHFADPQLNIKWPVQEPLVSEKDHQGLSWSAFLERKI